MSAPQITWIGVVVPAHNEQELLPGCLAGLAAAVAAVPVPVELLVVLDSCTDASPAAAAQVPTLTVDERNVGVARRSGFGRLLHSRPAGVPDSQTWLATTDADTVIGMSTVRTWAFAGTPIVSSAGWPPSPSPRTPS